MTWHGEERRSGKDRRLIERRKTMRYNTQTLIVVDGITWIDAETTDRRLHIRRREDREFLARKVLHLTRP